MSTPTPRRSGGRTHLETSPDLLVWALYGRESFDRKGNAEQVGNQLADMRPFVAAIGGRIGREYPENNVSAFKRVRVPLPDGTYGYRVVRPDWDDMMTALRRGAYNALCVPNIDRGMRDPRDLEDLIDLVEHYGVYVVGMTGNIDLTTDDGIASARHEVGQRNQESRNISRRVQTGNRRAALKGHSHGGGARPFGWRKDRIHVNLREAKHIRREVPRLLAGVRPSTIAMEWNDRGIPTVSGNTKWQEATIRQIFTSPRLCGKRVFHYRCPPRGWGGCGGVARAGEPLDLYVSTLVRMEQSKIRLAKPEEMLPWEKTDELRAVTKQISDTTAAFKARRISAARYFRLLEDLETDEEQLKLEKRRYDAKREARSPSTADLDAEWNKPSFTLELKQAAIAKSITAVIINPARRPGVRFDPNSISIVWRESEDEEDA